MLIVRLDWRPREIWTGRARCARPKLAVGWYGIRRATAMRALRLAVVPVGHRPGHDGRSRACRRRPATTTGASRKKSCDGFKVAIRGTNMDNRGIDYRERSPLVVPPTLDLPPPAASTNDVQIANWPKDPDERQRRAVIAAKKKNAPPPARVQVTTSVLQRPLRPARSTSHLRRKIPRSRHHASSLCE